MQRLTVYLKSGAHFSVTAATFTPVRDPTTGRVNGITWTGAGRGPALLDLDFREVAAVLTGNPADEAQTDAGAVGDV
jgi:hypothetical protein